MIDMRKGPGHAMRSIAIRIPAEMIEALDYRAGKLRTPRAVLCRNLLAQGLEQLDTAYAAWGELGAVSDADEFEGLQVLAQGLEALEGN
jgi:predicted DNA-binding protein